MTDILVETYKEMITEKKLSSPKVGQLVVLGIPGNRVKTLAKITKVEKTFYEVDVGFQYIQGKNKFGYPPYSNMIFDIKTNSLLKKHGGSGRPNKIQDGMELGKVPHIELADKKIIDKQYKDSLIEIFKKIKLEELPIETIEKFLSILRYTVPNKKDIGGYIRLSDKYTTLEN